MRHETNTNRFQRSPEEWAEERLRMRREAHEAPTEPIQEVSTQELPIQRPPIQEVAPSEGSGFWSIVGELVLTGCVYATAPFWVPVMLLWVIIDDMR